MHSSPLISLYMKVSSNSLILILYKNSTEKGVLDLNLFHLIKVRVII
jgi:hypothetical protein